MPYANARLRLSRHGKFPTSKFRAGGSTSLITKVDYVLSTPLDAFRPASVRNLGPRFSYISGIVTFWAQRIISLLTERYDGRQRSMHWIRCSQASGKLHRSNHMLDGYTRRRGTNALRVNSRSTRWTSPSLRSLTIMTSP